MNKDLINKAIDVMEKVKIGSLIRLHGIHNFRVVYQEPSYEEIYGCCKVPKNHVIRMVNETIPGALDWTRSESIDKLKIGMVISAVKGLYEDIELIEE